MGALRRVIAGHTYHYGAQTCGAIEAMRHPHQLQPCTRGFQPAVSCSRTRTLWIRFTTASRGGKPAERARGDVQPQPRRSKQPLQPYLASHGRVCKNLQPTWCLSCCSGGSSWIAHRRMLHTWPGKKFCVAPHHVEAAEQKFTAELRRKKPPRLRRDSEPREPPANPEDRHFWWRSFTYREENESLQRVARVRLWKHMNLHKQGMTRRLFYLCAPLCPRPPLLWARFLVIEITRDISIIYEIHNLKPAKGRGVHYHTTT